MAVGKLTIVIERKAWAKPAFTVLAYACAIVGLVSDRAAEWIAEQGCTFIVKRGHAFMPRIIPVHQ